MDPDPSNWSLQCVRHRGIKFRSILDSADLRYMYIAARRGDICILQHAAASNSALLAFVIQYTLKDLGLKVNVHVRPL